MSLRSDEVMKHVKHKLASIGGNHVASLEHPPEFKVVQFLRETTSVLSC